MPKVRTIRLAEYAICASCSAVGSMLTVVSPQKMTCFSNTSMYMPLTSLGLRVRADDLERGADRLGIVHVHAGDERVGVAAGDHHTSRSSCRCRGSCCASPCSSPLRCRRSQR